MKESTQSQHAHGWLSFLPPARWLAQYRAAWLPADVVAGVTLAAYAIPVALAYAGLAGLPPQAGVYGYLLGGLGYALLGSSRQLAIGPTSAISLMIAGTIGPMAEGDALHYTHIASLTGFTVALLCLIAWLLRLSGLVTLISDSILVGFKAGAALTIAITQLPSLLSVPGGGHNFFERLVLLVPQLSQTNHVVLVSGIAAIVLLVFGERLLPGRPVALGVVALSIVAASLLDLPALGVATTGEIPAGLPRLEGPALRLHLAPLVYEPMGDYEVLDDGQSIGRIYEIRAPLRPNELWLWSIMVLGAHRAGIETVGRTATFEEAKAQFKENYEQWQRVWAK